ncbi:hypothetical protein QW131_33840 [Roseibium salinum]|nr:hypothetical protein [Roseibium salinum]
MEKAKELLAASAYPDGFEVPLSISTDLASWMEPTALLIQESLGKLGIKTEIEKIPGANWRTAVLVEKASAAAPGKISAVGSIRLTTTSSGPIWRAISSTPPTIATKRSRL